MSTTPFLQPRFAFFSFFVYRSGIPLVIFLVSMSLLQGQTFSAFSIVLTGLLLVACELLVGKKAIDQPFWLLGSSILSIPAVALVGCLSTSLETGTLWAPTVMARARLVGLFQANLEQLTTVGVSCSLLVLWLLLFLTFSVFREHARPPKTGPFFQGRTLRARTSLLLLLPILAALLCLSPVLEEPAGLFGFEAITRAEGISFRHAAVQGRRLRKLSLQGLTRRGEEHNWSDERLLELYGSVALELRERDYRVNQHDTALLWTLTKHLEQMEPGDRRTALFCAATLAHNRTWRLGCTELLTAYFRTHTLSYLSECELSERELLYFQAFLKPIELYQTEALETEQGRLAALLQSYPELKLWGRSWSRSLPVRLYSLEVRLLSVFEGSPEPKFNPEAEALRLVLALRRKRIRDGRYPSWHAVPPELGQYRYKSRSEAELQLREIDLPCRPRCVLELR